MSAAPSRRNRPSLLLVANTAACNASKAYARRRIRPATVVNRPATASARAQNSKPPIDSGTDPRTVMTGMKRKRALRTANGACERAATPSSCAEPSVWRSASASAETDGEVCAREIRCRSGGLQYDPDSSMAREVHARIVLGGMLHVVCCMQQSQAHMRDVPSRISCQCGGAIGRSIARFRCTDTQLEGAIPTYTRF